MVSSEPGPVEEIDAELGLELQEFWTGSAAGLDLAPQLGSHMRRDEHQRGGQAGTPISKSRLTIASKLALTS
jgi:hypothetical protein